MKNYKGVLIVLAIAVAGYLVWNKMKKDKDDSGTNGKKLNADGHLPGQPAV